MPSSPPMRLLLALGLLLSLPVARAVEADVIVYGATPGGFCAAIAAGALLGTVPVGESILACVYRKGCHVRNEFR